MVFYWVFIEFSGVLLGFYRVCWRFTGFVPSFLLRYWVFTEFYDVLLFFLPGLLARYWVFIEFYGVLLGLNRILWLFTGFLPSFLACYQFCTEFYGVLLGFYRIFWHVTGFVPNLMVFSLGFYRVCWRVTGFFCRVRGFRGCEWRRLGLILFSPLTPSGSSASFHLLFDPHPLTQNCGRSGDLIHGTGIRQAHRRISDRRPIHS